MRDCENCKHRVMKVEVGKGTSPEHFWGCECWECEFEPTTKNDLGVEKIVDVLGSYTDLDIPYKHKIAEDILNNLSSVTPQEPKTGCWNDIPKYKDIAWQCSECERFTTMKHNYCPNCGCRMVEPQESEE